MIDPLDDKKYLMTQIEDFKKVSEPLSRPVLIGAVVLTVLSIMLLYLQATKGDLYSETFSKVALGVGVSGCAVGLSFPLFKIITMFQIWDYKRHLEELTQQQEAGHLEMKPL